MSDRLTSKMTAFQPSRAAIAGHPIHPVLVPLPIAFISSALATDLLYLRTSDRFWSRASKTLLGAGLVTGLMAAPFGTTDFLSIKQAREGSEGWLHGLGNAAVLGLTATNLLLRRNDRERVIGRKGIVLSATTAALLGGTGWLGGELSYRKLIGVAGPQDS